MEALGRRFEASRTLVVADAAISPPSPLFRRPAGRHGSSGFGGQLNSIHCASSRRRGLRLRRGGRWPGAHAGGDARVSSTAGESARAFSRASLKWRPAWGRHVGVWLGGSGSDSAAVVRWDRVAWIIRAAAGCSGRSGGGWGGVQAGRVHSPRRVAGLGGAQEGGAGRFGAPMQPRDGDSPTRPTGGGTCGGDGG